MGYTFGDSERASRRLALLAGVFEPTSEAFLDERGRRGGALAVDLGCGPGHTTRLVARVLGCARTVGLDASAAYVEEARVEAPPGVEFARHDVAATPYPTGPADALYARFLVTHLAEPEAALRAFASQLAPEGRLLLDEVEWIRSEAPHFRRYLELVDAVLASQRQQLFVGPQLAEIAGRAGRVVASDVRVLAVDPRDAAALFALNWETLREHEAVGARAAPDERDALGAGLAALRDGADAGAPITWGLRQVAIEA